MYRPEIKSGNTESWQIHQQLKKINKRIKLNVHIGRLIYLHATTILLKFGKCKHVTIP